jgi:site-specific recombinase XerD
MKESVMIKTDKKPIYMRRVEEKRRQYESKNLRYVRDNWIFYWKFLASLLGLGYRPRTIQCYYGKLNNFLKWLGNKSIRKVKKEDITKYILDLKSRNNYKQNTLRRFVITIRIFFNFVMRYSGITKNPACNLPLRLYKRQSENMDFFTQDEIEMIVKKPINYFNRIKKEDFKTPYLYKSAHYKYFLHYLILKIMFSTGIRPCELINITLKDFYYRDLKLRIQPKGSQQYIQKDRIVFITQKTADEIKTLIKLQKNIRTKKSQDKLFIHFYGWRLANNCPNRVIKFWANACGINRRIYAYMIRYTYCTRLVENGADIYALKKLMGHKELAVTLRHYLKMTRTEIHKNWKNFNPLSQEVHA